MVGAETDGCFLSTAGICTVVHSWACVCLHSAGYMGVCVPAELCPVVVAKHP